MKIIPEQVWLKFSIKQIIVTLAVIINLFLISDTITYLISGVLILILGIPHGASDPLIFNFINGSKIGNRVPLSFGLSYLLAIGVYLLGWIIFPKISFLLFLIISMYHFGETQFTYLSNKTFLTRVLALSWGFVVLTMLFIPHLEQLKIWMLPITGHEGIYQWISQNQLVILIAGMSLFVLSLVLIEKKVIMKELLELVLLYFLFKFTDILIGFAVFFCFWHSRDALMYQLRGFNLSEKKINLKKFIYLLLPYSAISILAIALLTGLSVFLDFEISWVIIFFIIIALLTLPHSILISKFYKKIN